MAGGLLRGPMPRIFPTRRRRLACLASHPSIGERSTRKLSFAIEVPSRTYLYDAYAFGLLWGNIRFRACIFDNYINLYFPSEKATSASNAKVSYSPKMGMYSWRDLKFLAFDESPENTRGRSRESLAGLISDAVKTKYVYAKVDEYFIAGRPCYHRIHHIHEMLLTDYDRHTGCMAVPTYNNGIYGLWPVPLSAIIDGLLESPRAGETAVILVSLAPGQYSTRPSIEQIEGRCEDYLCSRPSGSPCDVSDIYNRGLRGRFGCLFYEAMAEYIIECMDRKIALDLRATRFLMERHKLMTVRLESLSLAGLSMKTGNILAAYSRVFPSVFDVHLLAMKWNRDQAGDVVSVLVRKLKTVARGEEQCIRDLHAWCAAAHGNEQIVAT